MPSPNVRIRMTAVGAPPSLRFPNRHIVLSHTEKLMIGRTSKVEAKGCIAAENNGWIDSPVMSRSHAELSMDMDKKVISVQDVGSLHGTFVNGEIIPLERRMPYPIQDGDELRFGQPIVCGNETYKPTVLKLNYDPLDFEHNMSTPSRVFRPPPLLDDELYSGEGTDHSESGDSDPEDSSPCEADATATLSFLPDTTVLNDAREDEHDDEADAESDPVDPRHSVDPTSPAQQSDSRRIDSVKRSVQADSETEVPQDPQVQSRPVALPITAEMLEQMASRLSPRSPRYSPCSPERIYSPENIEESIRLSDSEDEDDEGDMSSHADSEDMDYDGPEDEEEREVCSHAVDSEDDMAYNHYDSVSDSDIDDLEMDMDKRSELETEEEHSSQDYGDFEPRTGYSDGLGPFARNVAGSNWAEDDMSSEDDQDYSGPSDQRPPSDPVSLADAFSPIYVNHILPVPTATDTTTRQASSFKIPSLLNPARPASPSDAALVKPVTSLRPILEPKSRIALLNPEKQEFFRARELNKLQVNRSEDKTPTPMAMLPADILDFGRVESNTDSAVHCKKATETPPHTSTPEETVKESAPAQPTVSSHPPPSSAPQAVPKLATSALLDSGDKFLNSPPPKSDWRDERRSQVEDEVPLISAADFHQHKSLKRKANTTDPVAAGGAASCQLETVSQSEPTPKRVATEAARRSSTKGTVWANMVEKVGFVALGGAVVLGSLIYSAPNFA